jgi:stearoyl-CoA desaturase (Delta-9 desaturase)
MNELKFDKGEVEVLCGPRYWARAGYFLFVSLLVIPGMVFAVRELWAAPMDALFVLPIAFLATSLGANTAYHMYFTHRTFATGPVFRSVLAFLGSILCQDSVAQWVASHKRHHRHVDIVGKDPHTPRQFGDSAPVVLTAGLFWASAGWKFSRLRTSRAFYASQIVADPISGWFDRHFVMISLAGLALPFFAGWIVGGVALAVKWFCYFGAFRVFAGYFFTEFVVNGLCHAVGSRKFDVKGRSTNLIFLAPLTLGATLHHNHHAFPRVLSPAIDGEIDPMKAIYWLLRKLGVIHEEPGPCASEVRAKMSVPTQG